MKKIIPGLLSMLLCLGMATGCDAVKEKLPDVKLPGFLENILGKESASSEEDTASESTPDSSTPDDSSEETPALHAHEQDLKDVKEYLQGIVNDIALETRKNFTLINSYSFFGETAKYDIAWSVNVDGVTVQEGETEDTIVIGELEADTPYVLTATITDPEGCHSVVAEFDAIALKAEQVVPEKITAAPAENTAYKLHMYQVSKAQDLYFTGVMKGFYLATTNASEGETYENGIDVYAEKVEGKDAYYLTFTNPEGKKQYIGVTNTYNNGSYHDNVILADSTEVAAEGDPTTFEFAWSNDYKTMVATLSGVKSGGTQDTTETKTTTYFLGTSGSYYTFGACPVEEAAESYVGCLVQMVNKADVAAEDKVAAEKETLNITTAFSGDVSEELPTKGSTYSDVAITWAVKSGDATITENVLTVASPAADTTIVLTATFTCGDASVTKDVEINVFPKSVVTEVTNPEENTAYAFYLYQANKAKNYYFTGKMDGNFLATTDDPAKAADVYAEKSGNGFMIYVLDASGAKSYIKLTEYKKNETDKYYKASVALSAEGSVFTLNTQFGMWVCNTGNDVFYLGTYNDYTTISSSAASYVKVDNAGVTQFIAKFGIIDESALPPAGGETPDPEQPETPSYETPEAILNALYALADGEQVDGDFTLTGKITALDNYNNPTIVVDGYENMPVYCYKLKVTNTVGEYITVKATSMKNYGGTYEFMNCTLVTEGGSEGGNEGEGETPSTPSEVVKATGDSFTIESYATANAWANSTLYATIEHEFYTITASGTPNGDWGLNSGKYYTSGQSWRIYQNESPAVTFTAVEGKTIATIKVTYAIKNGGILTFNGTNYESDALITVNAATATFSVGQTGTATNGQVQITAIEVLFAEDAPVVETYTLTLVNGENPRVPGAVTTSELIEGAALELPVLEAEGKTFKGWYLVDLATGMPSEEAPKIMPAAALTLKAVWEYEIYTLTIVNGETSTEFQFAVEYNGNIMISVNDLAYVLADNLVEGYKYEETIPEAFELKDYTFTLVEIPAEHVCSYEAVVTDPTCTEAGYTTYTCAGCGNSYTADEVNALGHKHEAVVTDPTCTEAGYTTYTCACGDSYTADEVAALGHADEDNNFKCDNCSKVMEPAAGEALTLAQAIALSNLYAHNTYTTNKYYITVTIVDVYNTQYGNANVIDAEGNKFVVYGMYNYDGKIRYDALEYKPVAGDEITVYGILGKYNSTLQMKNGWIDEVVAHEHDYSEVVTAPTCTTDGYTTVTCSICKASEVKDVVAALGHTTEAGTCERCGNEIGGESSEPAVVATFDFGANGTAAHVDGSSFGASKSYTVGTYSLALTGMANVYGPAYDAKGNSCIKLGASSKAGSGSFTVPENVTKVVIYAAKYKANTTKLTINGTTHTLTKNSNDGAYDAIEVDTTTTKTVTFTTVSGGYRCMINTVEFWA